MTFDYASENKIPVPACLLCGIGRSSIYAEEGSRFRTRRHLKPFIIAEKDRYGLDVTSVQCPGCSLVWISPRMTKAGYRRFYEAGEYRRLIAEHRGAPEGNDFLHRVQVDHAERIEGTVGTGWGTVLDVGGSVGGIGSRLGKEVTVLDPSPSELEGANGETICAMAEDWKPDRTWDLVLVCTALDHFVNPLKALKNLRRAVGKRLWVDVAKWPIRASQGGSIERAMKVDHPYSFTARTCRGLIEKAGYRVIETQDDWIYVGFLCE